jgi:hypothetical protein
VFLISYVSTLPVAGLHKKSEEFTKSVMVRLHDPHIKHLINIRHFM